MLSWQRLLTSGNEPASICAVLHSSRWRGIPATVGGDTPNQMSIGTSHSVLNHVCVAATCVPDHDQFWDRTGKSLVRRAEWIGHWIAEDQQNLYKSDSSDQGLWTNMDELRTKLHDLLRTPPGVRHAGAGSGMANMQTSVGASVAQPGES